MGKFLHAFFSPLGLRRAVPQVWDGFQTNIKLMVIAEILVLVLALSSRSSAGCRAAGACRCAVSPSSTRTSSAARRSSSWPT